MKHIVLLKNQSFSYVSLANYFYSSDFYYDKKLSDDSYRDQMLKSAMETAHTLFETGISLETINIGSKKGFNVSSLAEKLILRQCCSILRSHFSVKTKSRNIISQEIVSHLEEGTPYCIYRLDIKSFFESIRHEKIIEIINSNESLSTHTKNIIEKYLFYFKNKYQNGLPRGVEVSPILAEILLLPLDRHIRNDANVFYYARFVDDLLIITSAQENKKDFLQKLKDILPDGLFLNHNKHFFASVKKQTRAGNEVASFDFLGYNYTVTDTNLKAEKAILRKVNVDLSKSKIKKIKTRISKAFFNYSKTKDFYLLRDRLIFLTTNRDMKHKEKNRLISTGIYYNHSKINKQLLESGLKELDDFINQITFGHCRRLSNLVSTLLSKEQKKILLKISFVGGFESCVYKRFSLNRMREIVSIWK